MDKLIIAGYLIAIAVIVFAAFSVGDEWVKQIKKRRFDEWRHIPPPNWNSSRRRTGGDYW